VNDIERQVMDCLLRGDHPHLVTLREQLELSKVAARDFTGVGFFTHFAVPTSARRLPFARRVIIDDVHAEVSGLPSGAGFLLFVEQGMLDMLECFIYDDAWPPDAKLIRLYYLTPRSAGEISMVESEERNFENLLTRIGGVFT
jgi:hypothetical protein